MNSKYTGEQIEMYAAQFRVGDAIWCDNKWLEVIAIPNSKTISLRVNHPSNQCVVNWETTMSKDHRGGKAGFKHLINPYRVTKIVDYKLQGGEKIVWLGPNDFYRTFGKVYTVNANLMYKNDGGVWIAVECVLWGIIPRYEQVKTKEEEVGEIDKIKTMPELVNKNDKKTLGNQLNEICTPKMNETSKTFTEQINNKQINTDITLTLKDIEKLNQFNLVFHDSKHLVKLLDSLGNHEQANELMQNLLSVKEVVDGVNRQRNQIAKELIRKECNL